MTIVIGHCKRLPPYSIQDSIRTEISDSQVPTKMQKKEQKQPARWR